MEEMAAYIRYKPCLNPIPRCISLSCSWRRISRRTAWRIHASSSSSYPQKQTGGGLLLPHENSNSKIKERVFLLDVNPLCYEGSTPSLPSFAHWISLFFSQVSLHHPVIAVLDGKSGNEYRRQLLPSYKAHRRKFTRQLPVSQRFSRDPAGSSHQIITDVLRKCNVPVGDVSTFSFGQFNIECIRAVQVLKIEGHEADDVVATLVEQALQRGFRVVIGSPDKDFKQLISEDVQLVIPMPEFGRWSFYTLKHYIAQYNCDPSSDLSLRCIIGDEVDGVPGLQHVAPGFGRKTALKLLKKHGSLENLLNAAAVRTVGKQYAQDALTKHADYLRKNYEVLSLRRDVDVHLEEEWLSERDTRNDSVVLTNFVKLLGEIQKFNYQNASNLVKG
ncbi:hypothetical protein HHK36_004416 [Tetracentron sinense]|uniref:5'-3' exonuclease domain-containing protein n=1 Tax=Tetracentron sinense TaxID=13715 RepID=A0A835DTF2_TETSI|nr:hypothetical protein HHK36_004416 [Tetracentron sinense]